MGAEPGEAWAAREVGPEERWAGTCSAWPHVHSVQGEDEGAVGAVAHLFLLLTHSHTPKPSTTMGVSAWPLTSHCLLPADLTDPIP